MIPSHSPHEHPTITKIKKGYSSPPPPQTQDDKEHYLWNMAWSWICLNSRSQDGTNPLSNVNLETKVSYLIAQAENEPGFKELFGPDHNKAKHSATRYLTNSHRMKFEEAKVRPKANAKLELSATLTAGDRVRISQYIQRQTQMGVLRRNTDLLNGIGLSDLPGVDKFRDRMEFLGWVPEVKPYKILRFTKPGVQFHLDFNTVTNFMTVPDRYQP